MAGAANGVTGAHERRLMQSESRWLQQALFALSKAEDDRGKLVAAGSEEAQEMKLRITGNAVDLSVVLEAMTAAVHARAEDLRLAMNSGSAHLR
jgi:hypothetical protein